MLDPLLFRLLAMLFALLLITAGAHKLGDRLRFQGILKNYQVMPESLLGTASLIVPCLEILIGLGWVFAWRIVLVAAATVVLLAVYAAAMGINLLRGRTYIDCGCGFTAPGNRRESNEVQQLSVWLVYRNVFLIGLALLASTGITARSIGALDYFSIIAATLALVFAYGAFNQLLVNHNAINSWRKPLLLNIRAEADQHRESP